MEPLNRLGVGRPMNDRREPSVPPRTGSAPGRGPRAAPPRRRTPPREARRRACTSCCGRTLDLDVHLRTRVARLHERRRRPQDVLELDEALLGEAAHEQLRRRLRRVAGDGDRVQEALATLGGLRRPVLGQRHEERAQHPHGIHHLVLGVARVHVDAGHGDDGRVGAERLRLERPQAGAVDGVGDVGGERLHVEVLGAASHFLVGGEAHADRAVQARRVLLPLPQRLQDDGHAGLVVGAEQGGAVGRDDRQALARGQFRFLLDADDLRRIAGQHDVAAVVVAMDLRVHAGAGDAEVGVHVRDEPDGGHLPCGCGDAGHSTAASPSRSPTRPWRRRRGPRPSGRRRARAAGPSACRWTGTSWTCRRTACRSSRNG